MLAAAHLRFRPILMTSMAFILGVLPLVIASGAGSAGQRAIGTGVMGGMISATLLAVFFVPVFFVVVRRFFKAPPPRPTDEPARRPTQPLAGGQGMSRRQRTAGCVRCALVLLRRWRWPAAAR